MSNNFSIQNNQSRWRNYASFDFTQYFIAVLSRDTTTAVAGTFINVWFLAAMLLFPKFRSRLRNKIICGMLVVNLIETMIFYPITIFRGAVVLHEAYHLLDCYLSTFYVNFYHIQDFVGNWYIFILACVYTAQVMNFEPKLTPLWIKIATAVIITSPWVFALFFVPLIMKSYFAPYNRKAGCFFSTDEAINIFKSLDMIVPHSLTSLLLVVTTVLKYRRYPQGRSFDTLRAQLIDGRSHIDPVYPFIALLVTAAASDLCLVVYVMNPMFFFGIDFKVRFYLRFTFIVLAYLRVILVPVILLLFPDIRERIKTWRPCRRSATPTDLVVTYEKNTVSLTGDSRGH